MNKLIQKIKFAKQNYRKTKLLKSMDKMDTNLFQNYYRRILKQGGQHNKH